MSDVVGNIFVGHLQTVWTSLLGGAAYRHASGKDVVFACFLHVFVGWNFALMYVGSLQKTTANGCVGAVN